MFRAEEELTFDDVFVDGRHPTATYWAGAGASRVRMHAGVVPFQRATTTRGVTDNWGRVFREKPISAPPGYDEARDPYNGTH